MIYISRWRITGLVAIVLALMTGLTFALSGFNEDAVRIMIRVTARCSVSLFVLAFTASSLHSLIHSNWSHWLLRNRLYIGVSFALSHFVHLAFLILLASNFPARMVSELQVTAVIAGGLAYLFIAAMTITSFARPRKWLGERGWHLLHTSGIYYIWFVFIYTYGGMVLQQPSYIAMVILLLAALGIRIARMKRIGAGMK